MTHILRALAELRAIGLFFMMGPYFGRLDGAQRQVNGKAKLALSAILQNVQARGVVGIMIARSSELLTQFPFRNFPEYQLNPIQS